MTDNADRYLTAARRESTQRRYRQALEHFELVWGGLLPATSETVVRYLADSAERLSSSTLRAHLAALARWHIRQGFVDPTKAPQVRDVLRGIQALHPHMPRQAEPLQLTELSRCVEWLIAQEAGLTDAAMRGHRRDRALILLGFWRGFRSDDLCRLRAETIQIRAGEGMQLFLPSSKTDRDHRGRSFFVPALRRLCPVQAYEDWIAVTKIQHGPVFRALDRWGHLSEEALHPYSVPRILSRALIRSGVDADRFSGHSLRRGFATWAARNGWGTKALMDYVGWRDVQSALRYIEPDMPFGEFKKRSSDNGRVEQ
ncbi:site-specific integrase [Pseudomonas sp. MMS21-TM103]|uniref:site-specific integrase n=1 Tax=Pseudomonas sp. MMS21 TM103 TaxID=2886506 RepID=UPI001EE055A5|nr:site-specific integrase [Pseudomonas sp. MMS21 TM103]MCG4454948.1 site-specific integrase [Pseudomonas sp. MMS21 TM103]